MLDHMMFGFWVQLLKWMIRAYSSEDETLRCGKLSAVFSSDSNHKTFPQDPKPGGSQKRDYTMRKMCEVSQREETFVA